MTIKDDREQFLSRWSRLKQEARDQPEPKEPEKPADPKSVPELPPVDQLTHESDFKLFMDKRVDDRLRRLALKKLFEDPRFNLTDGLDDYAEDYTLLEDLPADMAALQQHARRILRGPEPEEPASTEELPGAQPGEPSTGQFAARSNERSVEDKGDDQGARAEGDTTPDPTRGKDEGQS